MAFNPINFITKGAEGLIDKGKSFLNAPDNSKIGIAKNTITGIPQAAKDIKTKVGDIFFSARGFEELNKKATATTKSGKTFELPFNKPVKTSFKEAATSIPKQASEIFTGATNLIGMIPRTPNSLLGQLDTASEKFIKTKTGGLVADITPKLEQYQKPKTIGEAQAMRLGDIGGFFNVGSIKGIKPTIQLLSRTQDPVTITKELKALGIAEDAIAEYLPNFIKASDEKVVSKLINEVQIPKPLREKAVELDIRQQALDESPFNRPDNRFLFDKEGRVKEIGDQKNARKLEDIMAETGVSDPTEFAQKVEEFQLQKKRLSDDQKLFKTDIQRVKETPFTKASEMPAVSQRILPEQQLQASDLPLNKTPELSAGEARSLEILAQQSAKVNSGVSDSVLSSLNDIIRKKGTDVKNKVGILDYVRTPENVFKKVGLEDEFNLLRKSEEAHKLELNKNIQKITDWSKQVPKESSQRIFKYLDGQAITLRDDELKVANEIKQYLSEWADRLNLPEDKRVSNYITHLFEDQFIKKEFDEDLAKIISDRIPGSVYDPFLLERLGTKGYKEDVWAALDAYVKRATRKVNLDPALEAISKKTNNLENSIYKYIKRYIDRVNLRPSEFETGVDNTIKGISGYKLGQRPIMKISRFLRQITFRGMIGANIGSAIRNLSQGINTYAKLGEKYTLLGYYDLAKNGMSELKSLGILEDAFVNDRSISAVKKTLQKVDDALFFFFDTAEKVNRGAAFYGARAKALASGKTLEEATDFAKKIVRDTQFSYGAIDTPLALQGDFNKLVLQFLSYPVKQTEFLAGMAKNKEYMGILRYILGGMAFVYTVGKTVGMQPGELVPFKGFLTGEQKFGTPPSLKLPVEIFKASVNAPDKYGRPRDTEQKLKDIGKVAWGVLPGGTQIKKTIEGIQTVNEGGSFDKAGNIQFTVPQDMPSKIQTILFGKYSSQNAKDYFNKTEIKNKEQEKVQPVYDRVQELKNSGDIEGAKSIVDNLSDSEYEVYKEIKSSETAKKTLENKKKILPTYFQVQKLKNDNKTQEAQSVVNNLSDDDYKAYTLVKKQIENQEKASKGITPEYEDGEPQTKQSIVSTVLTYGKALGVDPITAFNRIFTGQKIRYVSNGTIVVERMPISKSQSVKEKSGKKLSDVKLDHTVPLQLGGSNAESNLNLVPNAIWESYTPVENAIGTALRNNKISKSKAQQLIKDFKQGKLTAQQVTEELK